MLPSFQLRSSNVPVYGVLITAPDDETNITRFSCGPLNVFQQRADCSIPRAPFKAGSIISTTHSIMDRRSRVHYCIDTFNSFVKSTRLLHVWNHHKLQSTVINVVLQQITKVVGF